MISWRELTSGACLWVWLDRMVEDGHYPELEKLMTRIISQQKTYQQEYERHRQKAKKAQGGPGDRLCHAGRLVELPVCDSI